MPIHDWTRVGAGTFHYFHQRWMGEIADALNDGLLPVGYYAMTEQFAAGFGPDVLAPQAPQDDADNDGGDGTPSTTSRSGEGGVALARVELQPTAETDLAFYLEPIKLTPPGQREEHFRYARSVAAGKTLAVVCLTGLTASNRPVFIQGIGHPCARKLVLERGDLLPSATLDQSIDCGSIFGRDACTFVMSICAAELHHKLAQTLLILPDVSR